MTENKMQETIDYIRILFSDETNLSAITMLFYFYAALNFFVIANGQDRLESSAGKRYAVLGTMVMFALFVFYAMVARFNPGVRSTFLTCACMLFLTLMFQTRYLSLLKNYTPVSSQDSFKTVYYKRKAESVMEDYSFFRPCFIGVITGILAVTSTNGSGEAGILVCLTITILLDLVVDYNYWTICFKKKMLDNIYADEHPFFLVVRSVLGMITGMFVMWMANDAVLSFYHMLPFFVIISSYTVFKVYLFDRIKHQS